MNIEKVRTKQEEYVESTIYDDMIEAECTNELCNDCIDKQKYRIVERYDAEGNRYTIKKERDEDITDDCISKIDYAHVGNIYTRMTQDGLIRFCVIKYDMIDHTYVTTCGYTEQQVELHQDNIDTDVELKEYYKIGMSHDKRQARKIYMKKQKFGALHTCEACGEKSRYGSSVKRKYQKIEPTYSSYIKDGNRIYYIDGNQITNTCRCNNE
jgi:hypothetical protein